MAPYLQILFGMVSLMACYSVFKALIFNMHMFQLNGYRFSTHMGWLKKNAGRYAVEYIVFALSFTGLISYEPLFAFAASALFISLIAQAVENRNRPQKKPLVYTPRVKRMFVTTGIIIALLYGFSCYLLSTEMKNLAFLVIGLTASLSPLIIVLSNAVNKPVEFFRG
mgnify:CR=1 FL=1